MKATKPATISEIISATRSIAAGLQPGEVKQAATLEQPLPATPEGAALRKHAEALRSYDLSTEKLAGIQRVLDGDMPTREQIVLFQEKTASFDLTVERGDTHADTLRNLATRLRNIGEEVKIATHVEGFKTVRAYVSAEKLRRHLNA